MNEIVIYTDGGNRNTGNKLGQHVNAKDLSAWAYVIDDGSKQISASGFQLGATNNAMELTAVGSAFRKILSNSDLQRRPITLVSDSHYVLDPMTKGWLHNWMKTKKRASKPAPLANPISNVFRTKSLPKF